MSTEPDELLDRVAEAEVLAHAVEEYLDAHPLPVDDEEVARVTARLQARMAPRRPARWPWMVAAVGLAAAALALMWVTVDPSTDGLSAEDDPAGVLQATPHTETVRVVTVPVVDGVAGRPLEVDDQSTLLTSEQGATGAVLVQEGHATLDGEAVPEGHWAIVVNADAPIEVFPDGEAPPKGLPDALEEQLDDLRWRALPDRTLDALDHLLESR